MALTESAVYTCSVNPIGTDDFWILKVATAIGLCLILQDFSFLAGG